MSTRRDKHRRKVEPKAVKSRGEGKSSGLDGKEDVVGCNSRESQLNGDGEQTTKLVFEVTDVCGETSKPLQQTKPRGPSVIPEEVGSRPSKEWQVTINVRS